MPHDSGQISAMYFCAQRERERERAGTALEDEEMELLHRDARGYSAQPSAHRIIARALAIARPVCAVSFLVVAHPAIDNCYQQGRRKGHLRQRLSKENRGKGAEGQSWRVSMVPKLVCLRSAADTNRSGRKFGRTMREFADVSKEKPGYMCLG